MREIFVCLWSVCLFSIIAHWPSILCPVGVNTTAKKNIKICILFCQCQASPSKQVKMQKLAKVQNIRQTTSYFKQQHINKLWAVSVSGLHRCTIAFIESRPKCSPLSQTKPDCSLPLISHPGLWLTTWGLMLLLREGVKFALNCCCLYWAAYDLQYLAGCLFPEFSRNWPWNVSLFLLECGDQLVYGARGRTYSLQRGKGNP